MAFGQSPSPLAAYDETVLRQAGIGTDAASLLKHLRDYTQGNGDPKRINARAVSGRFPIICTARE